MSEGQLVKSIIDIVALKYRGRLKVWRNQTGALPTQAGGFVRFGALGSPDILGVLSGGRLLALEVKTKTGRVSQHQSAWLEEARDLGAVAVVVRSVDEALATIEEALSTGKNNQVGT